MSNRLGGKQGTAYLGTNANQPPNWTFSDRDPSEYDVNNVSLGDMWLNELNEDVWILVSLAGNADSKGSLATWARISSAGEGLLNALTGNTGGVVNPDGDSNINLLGDGVGITISGDPGTNTLTASLIGGGEAAQSFTTDSGTAVPLSGAMNIIADNSSVNAGSSVLFTGVGNTVTLNVTDSNDNTIIGRASGNLTITGGDNTILGEQSGISLTSGSDNTMIGGLTGIGITSGSNNILLGSEAGSSLETSDSSNVLIGHSGFAGSQNLVVIARGAGGVPLLHNYPGSNASTSNGGNLFIGTSAGNFTLAGAPGNAGNNGIGSGNLASLTTGFENVSMGAFSLNKLTTGIRNTVLGNNAAFNSGTGFGLITGSYNIIMGSNAGDAYVADESSNIIIGNYGELSENNTIRVGSDGTGDGEQSRCFVAAIRDVTPDTNDGIPVYISSDGQLGTVGSGGTTLMSTLTADSGVVVSPLAGNINIVGDGVTATVTGNALTHTLTISAVGGGGGVLNNLADDNGNVVVPLAGQIDVITNNATQGAGSSVIFDGTVANTLILKVSDALDNTIIGEGAGNGTLTGIKNAAFGTLGLSSLTTGSENATVGYGAGTDLTTGSYNVLLGYLSGSNYTSNESSNIIINSIGTTTESNVLRLGSSTGSGATQLSKSFIHGIRGVTPDTTDGVPVFIGSAGQLGTVGNGGTVMAQTITGNSGGAVGPASGNINIVGDGVTATVVGNPGTNTLTISALGGGGGDLTVLAGDSGSATPVAGTINVVANHAILGCGSSVLFSGSADDLILSVTDSNNNTLIGKDAGKLSISGTKNTSLGRGSAAALTTGTSNLFIGNQAGNLVTTGTGNFLCGDASLNAVLQGTTTATGLYGLGASTGSLFLHNWGAAQAGNTFVGYGSGSSFNAGQNTTNRNNTALGINSLQSITTASTNTALGRSTGLSLTTGTGNTLVGNLAGSNYTSSESNNIMINNLGTATESNVLRIGGGTGTGTGQVNKAFISGIRGVTTGISNAIPVVIDSAGQLGTAGGSAIVTTLTGNTGGAVSSTGGNINIVGDGVSVNVSGNPGTSTLTISAVGGAGGPSFVAYMNTDYEIGSGYVNIDPIPFDTVAVNIGSAFNTGTSIFTAPVSGFYNFSCQLLIIGDPSLVVSDITFRLVTSSLSFRSSVSQTVNTLNYRSRSLNGNFYVYLTAGDTAQMGLITNNPFGTPRPYISGVTSSLVPGINSFFSGTLA